MVYGNRREVWAIAVHRKIEVSRQPMITFDEKDSHRDKLQVAVRKTLGKRREAGTIVHAKVLGRHPSIA